MNYVYIIIEAEFLRLTTITITNCNYATDIYISLHVDNVILSCKRVFASNILQTRKCLQKTAANVIFAAELMYLSISSSIISNSLIEKYTFIKRSKSICVCSYGFNAISLCAMNAVKCMEVLV